MKKVAIFVDWENIRIGVFEEAAKTLSYKVSYNDINNVIKYINSFIDDTAEEIYRIFFYLADPYGGIVGKMDYSKTPTYIHATSFIEKLGITEYVAIRKGTLIHRGYDINKKPIFIQKKSGYVAWP